MSENERSESAAETDSHPESEDGHELLGLEREDLEKAALLYENIRAQRRNKESGSDKQLADDFVKFLEEVHTLNNPLENAKIIKNNTKSKYPKAY